MVLYLITRETFCYWHSYFSFPCFTNEATDTLIFLSVMEITKLTQPVSPRRCKSTPMWYVYIKISIGGPFESNRMTVTEEKYIIPWCPTQHIMWQSPPLKQGISFPAVLSKWMRLLTYMLSQATSSWHTCSHRLHAGLDTDALPQQCHLLLFSQAWYYAPLLSTHCCCTELRKERNEVLGWRSQ